MMTITCIHTSRTKHSNFQLKSGFCFWVIWYFEKNQHLYSDVYIFPPQNLFHHKRLVHIWSFRADRVDHFCTASIGTYLVMWSSFKIYNFNFEFLRPRIWLDYLKQQNWKSFEHSSEIRGLCLMKWPSKSLQNLPYFWNMKTLIVF